MNIGKNIIEVYRITCQEKKEKKNKTKEGRKIYVCKRKYEDILNFQISLFIEKRKFVHYIEKETQQI